MKSLVLAETREALGLLTLNQPETHNALSSGMLHALDDVLTAFSKKSEVRAILLTANGSSFSTGFDWRTFPHQPEALAAHLAALTELLNRVILRIMQIPVPVITIAHDIVGNGAAGFVLASDYVLIAPQTIFEPVLKSGFAIPLGGWSTLMPDFIGRRHTTEALLGGKPIHAEAAFKWGLANDLVPSDHLPEKGLKTAAEFAKQNAIGIQETKHLLRKNIEAIALLLEEERQSFLRLAGSELFLQALGI